MEKKQYTSPLVEVNQLKVCELMALTGPASMMPGPSSAPKRRTEVF